MKTKVLFWRWYRVMDLVEGFSVELANACTSRNQQLDCAEFFHDFFSKKHPRVRLPWSGRHDGGRLYRVSDPKTVKALIRRRTRRMDPWTRFRFFAKLRRLNVSIDTHPFIVRGLY